MRKKVGLWMTMAMLVCFAGCSSANSAHDMAAAESAETTSAEGTWIQDDYLAEEVVLNEEAGASKSGEAQVVDTNRKLIKNVYMSVETKQFDELLINLQSRCEELGGYVEEKSVYNGSAYYGYNTTRNAYITLRIPSKELETYLADVESKGNVTNRDESVQDVTLSYVDMQSRKDALRAEQERLMELLAQAESVEDLIAIESRLSEVRYQIESMESQLRTFDNQIDYSTVRLDINEVENLTQVEEESTGARIVREFSENAKSALRGIKEFAIGIVVNLPYIIEWAIIIGVVVLVIRMFSKRKRNRQNKEMKKQEDKEVEDDK